MGWRKQREAETWRHTEKHTQTGRLTGGELDRLSKSYHEKTPPIVKVLLVITNSWAKKDRSDLSLSHLLCSHPLPPSRWKHFRHNGCCRSIVWRRLDGPVWSHWVPLGLAGFLLLVLAVRSKAHWSQRRKLTVDEDGATSGRGFTVLLITSQRRTWTAAAGTADQSLGFTSTTTAVRTLRPTHAPMHWTVNIVEWSGYNNYSEEKELFLYECDFAILSSSCSMSAVCLCLSVS